MDYIKILHFADVHIGRKYNNLSTDKAKLRYSETLISLQNTLERFSDSQIVLVSGDLFEENCSDNAVAFVAELFSKHTDKYFFVSCGNHDCCESHPIKELIRRSDNNVYVFGDTIQKIDIESLNASVYGVSFSAPCSYTSLLTGFTAQDKNTINIMTMHADVVTDSKYNPVTKQEIADSGLSYLALGHVHSFSGIMDSNGVSYAYPGVLEPGGFDEQGECGVIYGKVYKDRTELDFYPVSCRRYVDICLDISNIPSNELVIGKLTSIINPDDLYRVSFEGTCNGYVPDTKLYSDACKAFFLEFIDNTKSETNILDYFDEYSLRGLTAKALVELEKSCNDAVFLQACEILTNLMCKG